MSKTNIVWSNLYVESKKVKHIGAENRMIIARDCEMKFLTYKMSLCLGFLLNFHNRSLFLVIIYNCWLCKNVKWFLVVLNLEKHIYVNWEWFLHNTIGRFSSLKHFSTREHKFKPQGLVRTSLWVQLLLVMFYAPLRTHAKKVIGLCSQLLQKHWYFFSPIYVSGVLEVLNLNWSFSSNFLRLLLPWTEFYWPKIPMLKL